MKHSRTRVSSAVVLLLTLLGSAQVVADPVRISGTNVSLQPPEGFERAERFPGFQSAEQQVSIMVTQMPAPVAEVMKGMNKEALATQGMTLLSSSATTVGGREALLLQVAQAAGGSEYLKWMLVTGDPKTSVLIVGAFPKSAGEEVAAAIRTSLLTASLASESPGDPFEPIYIVGRSFGPGGSENLRAFSEARAQQTAQIRGLENISGREITIGGLTAYELLADAKDVKSGASIRLYQVIAPDGDGYFIVQGLMSADRTAEILPEFRR